MGAGLGRAALKHHSAPSHFIPRLWLIFFTATPCHAVPRMQTCTTKLPRQGRRPTTAFLALRGIKLENYSSKFALEGECIMCPARLGKGSDLQISARGAAIAKDRAVGPPPDARGHWKTV